MKKLLILSILVCWLANAYCQSDNKTLVLNELNNLSEKYRTSAYLSFDILYKYSREDKPEEWLDSLGGRFKMNGSSYWYNIDSTEAMADKDYTVLLFKTDQLMYLVPSKGRLSSANPLALLDSFLLKSAASADITETGNRKVILLHFAGGSKCKKIEFDIDKRTGLLTRMVNTIKGSELYDPSVSKLVEGDNVYAIVETIFSNYAEKSFNGKILESSNYFKREDGRLMPVSPYESYQIVLSTPNQ